MSYLSQCLMRRNLTLALALLVPCLASECQNPLRRTGKTDVFAGYVRQIFEFPESWGEYIRRVSPIPDSWRSKAPEAKCTIKLNVGYTNTPGCHELDQEIPSDVKTCLTRVSEQPKDVSGEFVVEITSEGVFKTGDHIKISCALGGDPKEFRSPGITLGSYTAPINEFIDLWSITRRYKIWRQKGIPYDDDMAKASKAVALKYCYALYLRRRFVLGILKNDDPNNGLGLEFV
jgi:hypothetical protein